MHRIDGDGHVANAFTEGNPSIGQQATQVTDDWLNDVQEEIAKVVEACGITLVKGTTSQLLAGLKAIGLFGGASGDGIGQIKFPSTQNPSADANTLDDYEEGTWTPVLGGAGGTSGQSYAVQVGRYLKIGQLVFLYGAIELSAKGTITGAVVVSGLPFTSLTAAGLSSIGPAAATDLATNWIAVHVLITSNTVVAPVRGAQAAGASTDVALATADIANNTKLSFSLCYRAAA